MGTKYLHDNYDFMRHNTEWSSKTKPIRFRYKNIKY